MTLTEIRNAVISRMAAQTAIASDAVDYPNGPVFDPSNRDIWARLTNIAGQAGATEIGDRAGSPQDGLTHHSAVCSGRFRDVAYLPNGRPANGAIRV